MPLAIIELLLKIALVAMEGQPPDVRVELWRMFLTDLKEFRVWWASLAPKGE